MADLARELGELEDAVDASKAAADSSVRSKVAASYGSQQHGDGSYRSPAGVLPEGQENRDPRGVPQPVGAHLSGRTTAEPTTQAGPSPPTGR